jgi:hypothetical protein
MTAAQAEDWENNGVASVPFPILMERAVKLRTHLDAPLRSNFGRFPVFYQNSVFPTERVLQARACESFEERLTVAVHLKEEGNALFLGTVKDAKQQSLEKSPKTCIDSSDLSRALNHYEMALAIFRYLNNTNLEWRSQVNQDDVPYCICMYVPWKNADA